MFKIVYFAKENYLQNLKYKNCVLSVKSGNVRLNSTIKNDQENYYEILGLKRDCMQEDIRFAYLNLCKKYHPDKLTNYNCDVDNHKRFLKINEAYNCLCKIDSRNRYDLSLDCWSTIPKNSYNNNYSRPTQHRNGHYYYYYKHQRPFYYHNDPNNYQKQRYYEHMAQWEAKRNRKNEFDKFQSKIFTFKFTSILFLTLAIFFILQVN